MSKIFNTVQLREIYENRNIKGVKIIDVQKSHTTIPLYSSDTIQEILLTIRYEGKKYLYKLYNYGSIYRYSTRIMDSEFIKTI
jgi:hypothetical protein